MICLAIYGITVAINNRWLAHAFPDMETVLGYKDGVRENQWAGFIKQYPNIQLIVFSQSGERLYASDENVETEITVGDLNFIEDVSGGPYYRVERIMTEDGRAEYMVFLMRKVDGDMVASQVCTLDGEYRVVSGELFRDRESLSSHEMQLMLGEFRTDMQVSRASYTAADGTNCIVVLLSPTMSSRAYDRVLNRGERSWVLAAILILMTVVIGSLRLNRRIRRDMDAMVENLRSLTMEEYREETVPETVTEFQIIAEEVHSLMGRLDEAVKQQKKEEWERRRVIASLTHDLKTPIAVIMGYTQAFRDNRIAEDQREHYYSMLCEKSRLAVDMIDSMSEYAKMEHPDFRLQTEKTELSEFLRQYLMSVYDELTEGGVDLYPELEEDNLFCMLDRRMFLRVMSNLIGNTRKYNPGGVRLRIAARTEGDRVCIVVEDDGVGIEPELRDAVFHPFVTSNEARTSGKGTGLGLAIVDRIIKNHGGSISLEDSETEGYHTEFRILLPKVS